MTPYPRLRPDVTLPASMILLIDNYDSFTWNLVQAFGTLGEEVEVVRHDGRGVFEGLANPLTAMRYHSLVVEEASLPPELEGSAWTEEGELMGLRHRTLPVEGVQFHPESYRTPAGLELLRNFLRD